MLSRFQFMRRLVKELPSQIRLAYCLMRDPRVPIYTKGAFAGGLGILLTPVINLPENIPLIGELDALAVTLLALRLFIAACPDEVVIDVEQQIIEQISVFDDDVRRGERIATHLYHRFRPDGEHDVVGNATRTVAENRATPVPDTTEHTL